MCGQDLPGDRDFFGNRLVQERLSKYHALIAMLGFFRKVHGDGLARRRWRARAYTVNTVSPGYIATEMVMAVAGEHPQPDHAQIPVGRLGEAQEVAYLVDFLASDKASFIIGANFAMNGGQHMMCCEANLGTSNGRQAHHQEVPQPASL